MPTSRSVLYNNDIDKHEDDYNIDTHKDKTKTHSKTNTKTHSKSSAWNFPMPTNRSEL